MKLLKQRGYPYDDKTFEIAVEYGGFGKIKWLRENGCPGWDKHIFNIGVNRLKNQIIKDISENLKYKYDYEYSGEGSGHYYEGHIEHTGTCYNIEIHHNVIYDYLYYDIGQMIFYGDKYIGPTINHNILHYLIENNCPGWEKYNMRITYRSNKVMLSIKHYNLHILDDLDMGNIRRLSLRMKNVHIIN